LPTVLADILFREFTKMNASLRGIITADGYKPSPQMGENLLCLLMVTFSDIIPYIKGLRSGPGTKVIQEFSYLSINRFVEVFGDHADYLKSDECANVIQEYRNALDEPSGRRLSHLLLKLLVAKENGRMVADDNLGGMMFASFNFTRGTLQEFIPAHIEFSANRE